MNLFDNCFLIIFACGFLNVHLTNLVIENEEPKSDNLNKKSQNIQEFCQPNVYDSNRFCPISVINTSKGKICKKWKYSKWNKNDSDEKFCQNYTIYYYCAISDSKYTIEFDTNWVKCRDFVCTNTTFNKTCQSNIQWSSTSSSIEIDYSRMSPEINFLIFTYTEPNECLVSKICQNYNSTNYIVNYHFDKCKLIQERINNKVMNFTNLLENTQYTFYLMYVFNNELLGELAKLSLKTEATQKSSVTNLWVVIFMVVALSIFISVFVAVKKFNFLKFTGKPPEIHNEVEFGEEPVETISKSPVMNTTVSQSELVHELMTDQASILKAYQDIVKTSQQIEREMELTSIIASLFQNMEKNRVKNIHPFDQTRVILKENSPGTDYINASLISFENDSHQAEYIAAQGPNEASISDFWLMIWEQNISIIVMLTKTHEDGNEKCIQYWPDQLNNLQSFGPNALVSVSLKDEIITGVYIERNLSVKHVTTNEKRNIVQLQIETWHDYSVPKLKDFESLLYRFHQLISSTTLVPYLIHCSDGAGRTGTFIVIDRIIRKLTSGKRNLYIQDEVLKVRKCRNFIVSSQAYYIFIYEFIRYFLEKNVHSSEGKIFFSMSE